MTLDVLFHGGLIAYLAGAAAGLACIRRAAAARPLAGMALLGALAETAASGLALIEAAPVNWVLPSGVPLFSWTVTLDPLSALFCLALGLLAIAVSIFSFGYLRDWEGRKNVGLLGFFYNVLLLSLTLVFSASNAFFFLLVWEVMALSAYCLVSGVAGGDHPLGADCAREPPGAMQNQRPLAQQLAGTGRGGAGEYHCRFSGD